MSEEQTEQIVSSLLADFEESKRLRALLLKKIEQLGNPKLLYSIEETAHILSVSTKTIERWVKDGLLKKHPGLRHIRITRESIEAFVKMGC